MTNIFTFAFYAKSVGFAFTFAYTFLDMRNFLYHSLIISSAEHEAHYVIDGAMRNDVVKSDIHLTDTGGYSEILFGVMHLLGFAFAPRIKNFTKCQFYAFNKRKLYQQQGYKILPDAYIKEELIAPQWDEVLRFIATIKLKEATLVSIRFALNPSHNCSNGLIHTPVNIRSILPSRSLAKYPRPTFYFATLISFNSVR